MTRSVDFWGPAVFKFRLKHGLTQQEFAIGCGISKNEVAKIERRLCKNITVRILAKLIRYMNINE